MIIFSQVNISFIVALFTWNMVLKPGLGFSNLEANLSSRSPWACDLSVILMLDRFDDDDDG